MNPSEILEQIYLQAVKCGTVPTLAAHILAHVDVLLEKIDRQKSQVSALVTSCLEKICRPEQDIRYETATRGVQYNSTAGMFQIPCRFAR